MPRLSIKRITGKIKPEFILSKKEENLEFFLENDCDESRAVIDKDFYYWYIECCPELHCYGGRGC